MPIVLKAIKLFILFFFYSFISNAQKVLSNNNVRSYYYNRNMAELAIVDINYNEANGYYKKAFESLSPHLRDVENAFTSAYYSNDSVLAKYYADMLAYRLYPVNTIWAAVDSTKSFNHFVIMDVDSIIGSRRYQFPENSYQFIDSLFKIDQKIRSVDTSKSYMQYVDANNLNAVLKFIIVNGYPNSDPDSKSFAVQPTLYSLFVLLWHHRSDTNSTQLDDLLQRELIGGNILCDDWATLMMYREGFQEKYLIKLWLVNIDTLTEEEIVQINDSRAEVFLEPLEDYKRKYDYEKMLEHTIGCSVNGHPFKLLNSFLVPSDNAIKAGLK